MRPLRPVLALCLAVTTISALPDSAFAQASDADKATARVLGQEGQEALDKKDFKTASDRFKRADSLFHAPTLALGLARSLAGEGKLVAAQETYNRLVREGVPPGAPEAFKRAVQEAGAEVAQISPKIGAVTITVAGTDTAKVTLDDAPVPQAALGVRRPVDPGPHVIKATADGFKPAEVTVAVAEGGAATAALQLEKDVGAVAAAPPPLGVTPTSPDAAGAATADLGTTRKGSSARTIGFVALGVGAAGLAAGAVTGLMAMGKASDLKEKCTDGACPPDQQSNIDSYKTLGLVSTIGFVVGAVGAGAGIYFIVTAPKESTPSAARAPSLKPTVTPYLGLGTAGVTGRF